MSVNVALAREIYGMNVWCVDQATLPALLSILQNFRNGVALELPEQKYNSVSFLDLKSNEIRLVKSKWDLRNGEQFYGVGIIALDGVITVSGGASSYGVDYLSEQMQLMAKDDRVKSFIVLGNSGGGSSMAVEIMTETIEEIDKTKPVYGLVKKGGMSASACYGIMTACRKLYAESEMSLVGSAGTMMQFEGREANNGDEDMFKTKHIRIYAPESTHKNKGFEEAIQNDNFDYLIDNMLKPFNQRFLSLIERYRPTLKSTDFRNGRTVFAKDAVGTYIDGIKSFSNVLEMAAKHGDPLWQDEETKNGFNNENSNINQNVKMTKTELQNAHPDVYNSIVQEGVSQERDRVGAWMAHVGTDSTKVVEGISSGNTITQTEREAFFVKQNAQNAAKNLVSESSGEVTPKQSADALVKTPEQIAQDKEMQNAFGFWNEDKTPKN